MLAVYSGSTAGSTTPRESPPGRGAGDASPAGPPPLPAITERARIGTPPRQRGAAAATAAALEPGHFDMSKGG